ncbi:MAG TPA: DUF1127 domain-containing protein [Geminicoccaceae bacterium]
MAKESIGWVGRHFPAPLAAERRLQVWFERLLLWDERHRARRRLLAMDERGLKDLGITRADARAEADKPFWRA